jgi:hypothetical protein
MKYLPMFAGVTAAMAIGGCAETGKISTDIANACNANLPIVQALAPIASADPTGAAIVAGIEGGCTLDGMVQMTINDSKPVTATNSGASANWVETSTAVLKTIAKK